MFVCVFFFWERRDQRCGGSSKFKGDAGITDYYTSTYCPFIIALEKVMVSCLIELLQSVY